MTKFIPGEYGDVSMRLRLNTDPEPFYLTFGLSAIASDAIAESILAQVVGSFEVELLDQLAAGYKTDGADMRYHVTGETWDDPLHVVSTTQSDTSTATSAPLPQNTAYLVHKRSALAGRRHRGRLYIPGCFEAEVAANGVVSSAFTSGFQTGLNDWLDFINGEGHDMVILHTADTVLTVPAPTVVTSLELDPVVATQRRRLRP